ncbi:hypothetical protein HRI_004071900 [Hibiscus trionum]|uniref:Uncharacterized protein n=1 Tax=Hibiscus trionum TaxID=183268 RepID=A0A9W7IX95_HIBTR|nr:hypothetical protein HRI_004071900 [Hibiscus trionum]
MYFARQGSAYQACFMRQVSRGERTALQSAAPTKSSCAPSENSNTSKAPLFSRPQMMDPDFSNSATIRPLGLDWRLSMPDPPMFARPNKSTSEAMTLQYKKKTCQLVSFFTFHADTEWYPRMDVAESGLKFRVSEGPNQ